ncbi:hypothetical protein KUV57_12945 [Epibacterium sp. DP7N7-1]|nr:hypothetical protein [Epibacterium sp. DP7N7-1]
MGIDFQNIDQEDQVEDGDSYSNVGVIFFGEDGSWHARRHGTDFSASGEGVPQSLEPGLWVADMGYDEVRAISKEMRGLTMRSDSWLKLSVEQIRTAFGLSGRPLDQSLPIVSTIAHRVFRLTQEALRCNLAELRYRAPQEYQNNLERSASLATAIAMVNAPAVSRTASSEKRVIDHFTRTYQAGMYLAGRKDPPEGHINLAFHFPRLSYARKVTEANVPASSIWQVASRKDSQGVEDFVSNMRETGRPAIYKAVCQPGELPVPEYIQVFANGLNSSVGDTHRTRFIDEEIKLLSRYYRVSVEGVIAGSGWCPSATGRLIKSLEDTAGGCDAAHASWSVGLAAENILASALRSVRKETPGQTAEAVWIAARDRAAMIPAIEALVEMGASLVSAHYGNITVRTPLDIELMMLVVNAAWESGLVLPLESVEQLRQMGVPIPVEPSLFGGNDVDYLLSAVVHRRQRNALWSLDGIMDLPSADRARKFRVMTSA